MFKGLIKKIATPERIAKEAEKMIGVFLTEGYEKTLRIQRAEDTNNGKPISGEYVAVRIFDSNDPENSAVYPVEDFIKEIVKKIPDIPIPGFSKNSAYYMALKMVNSFFTDFHKYALVGIDGGTPSYLYAEMVRPDNGEPDKILQQGEIRPLLEEMISKALDNGSLEKALSEATEAAEGADQSEN